MKNSNVKKQHFINLRKLEKPTSLCISALFVISILLAFSSTAVHAATTPTQVAVPSITASSYDGTHTPNLAIDGSESTSNYWGTNAMIATGQLPQWLQLDLGTQTSISQIITHFYDGDSRTYTYYIQASTDGSTWTTIVPTKTGNSIVTDTFTQATARYVKITITSNTANLAAHIEEIKIYQSTTSTTTPTPTPTQTPTPTPAQNPSQTTTPTQVAVPSITASSYDGTHTPNLAIDGSESTSNYWGTNAMIATGQLPQWLQLDLGTQTSISQIITHFYDGDSRTYTYYIQASTDGSTWTTIVPTKTGNSIVTDTFTQATARYVKITITSNTANLAAHIEEIKIYQSTTSTTTPTPTPTQTPTPTKTPTPTATPAPTQKPTQIQTPSNPSTGNPIAIAWSTNSIWAPSFTANVHVDNSVLYDGQASIRIDPHTSSDTNYNRECDADWTPISPGDHIIFSVWMKTSASTLGQNGNQWYGARIGMSFLAKGPIADTASPDGLVYNPNTGVYPTGQTFVPWGTNTWTHVVMDFVVASSYPSSWGSYPVAGQMVAPTGIIPWMQVTQVNDGGQAWFANPQLFINP